MENVPKFQIPTIFVIFGITGDLVKKKILKAIYDLYLKNLLPEKIRIYGFSRRDYNDAELKAYLKEIMMESGFSNKEKYDEFLSKFSYIKGDFFEYGAYQNLASKLGMVEREWSICSNKLFYLAVPPQSYSSIVENLHKSGLTKPCSPTEGWTRVILEKPFGTDLKTANMLDKQLGKLFKEEQIYRVDHYLAKETVKNILVFRFSNSFLSPAWNKKYIKKIEVKLFEKIAVEKRGNFYDKVGALRDVGQNHMLQLLALFIMDPPKSLDADEIKSKRSKAISSLKIMSKKDIETLTKRGQYKGYRQEKGVNDNSQTETYFKIQAGSTLNNFEGVPLFLESGKAQKKGYIEVKVTFKESPFCLYTIPGTQENVLHYYLKPDEKISMCFLAKKPGYEYKVEEHDLKFDYHAAYENDDFVDDYESLLYDIIRGDQTVFVSTDEIISEWKFIEPIVKTWSETGKPELEFYEKGEAPTEK